MYRTNALSTSQPKVTILVVDDEQYIVDLLHDLLVDEGYRVQRARDGQAALKIVEAEAPDLIIADVMMPRMDGLALVHAVRERAYVFPVILMSAAVTPRMTNVTFVPKPFDIDDMLDLIEKKVSVNAP